MASKTRCEIIPKTCRPNQIPSQIKGTNFKFNHKLSPVVRLNPPIIGNLIKLTKRKNRAPTPINFIFGKCRAKKYS